MIIQQTKSQLSELKLNGVLIALDEQFQSTTYQQQCFEDRLGHLVDTEYQYRKNNREKRMITAAKFSNPSAFVESIDYLNPRGLDKPYIDSLMLCDWVVHSKNIFFIGPTGVGKTWLACAMANQAIRKGYKVRFYCFTHLLEDMAIAYKDGSLGRLRTRISKFNVLIIDDWAVSPIDARGRQDLLEIVNLFYQRGSLIITSQLPISEWHSYIGAPTQADSILDRIVHCAHKINLKGESMRKVMNSLKGDVSNGK
ncbi:MAG: ATP-binding protein [Colwellia sp.]|nr:ATP-binding protein [Colwellia sp.]